MKTKKNKPKNLWLVQNKPKNLWLVHCTDCAAVVVSTSNDKPPVLRPCANPDDGEYWACSDPGGDSAVHLAEVHSDDLKDLTGYSSLNESEYIKLSAKIGRKESKNYGILRGQYPDVDPEDACRGWLDLPGGTELCYSGITRVLGPFKPHEGDRVLVRVF